MFVTTPEMQLWIPPGVAPPSDTHWGSVMLASDMPWFLLSVWEISGTERFQQTIAIAWESTLRRMVTASDPDRLVGLSCIRHADDASGQWCLDKVSELWVANGGVRHPQEVLLFARQRGGDLFDSHGTAADPMPEDRCLLARFGV